MSILLIGVVWGVWFWSTFFQNKNRSRLYISVCCLLFLIFIPYEMTLFGLISISSSYLFLLLICVIYVIHPSSKVKIRSLVLTIWCGGTMLAGVELWNLYDPIVLMYFYPFISPIICLVLLYSFSSMSIYDKMSRIFFMHLFMEFLLCSVLYPLHLYRPFFGNGNGQMLAYTYLLLFFILTLAYLFGISTTLNKSTYQTKRKSDTLYE
ncbi:YphA family membrane protein [Mangrovibacillus cuniculi]|uniref:YphA family membrane protein n=1 Tax=Mangrovibacillus cuniculi TaxID=2593652 RepID=UPI003B84B32C